MANKYIELENKQEALDLSAAFFEMVRPEAIRNPEDVTKYWYSVIEHPSNGKALLEVDDEEDFNIPAKANLDKLDQVFERIFNKRSNRPEKTVGKKIKDREVARVRPQEFIPDALEDRASVEAKGYFQTEETP